MTGFERSAVALAAAIVMAAAIGRNALAEDRTTKAAGSDVVINAGGSSYDSQPSFAVLPDGATWIAWRAYYRGQERILVRSIRGDKLGRLFDVAPAGVHDSPHVVAAGRSALWVFWSTRVEGRWRIAGRSLQDGNLSEPTVLSGPRCDAIHPAAAAMDDGRLVLAYCAYQNGRFRIQRRLCKGGVWGRASDVSSPDHDSFRPALAADPAHGVWAFWDSYVAGGYAVMARPILPKRGPVERVTPMESNGLKPTALVGGSVGLCVAWLTVTDVVGGEGAIDQKHTLHMAVRGGDGWQVVADSTGQTEAATLTHGLLARMKPKPGPIWGYMGRRRCPMLAERDGTVWLLWERKSKHDGSTTMTVGQLVGRPYTGGRWGEPVVLHKGLVDYHVAGESRTEGGTFPVVASQLPRKHRRIYHRVMVDANQATRFSQEAWSGWRPVKLPLEDEVPRRAIPVDGRRYTLYWADTHAHSGLSADAEGEPDELLHYARDRARLDVVVIQENDEIYNCPLTESEYALGGFFARCATREGRFLALPGFEWTQRMPKDPTADPANHIGWPWTGTFPNHRTVIYPPGGGPIVRWTEVRNDVNALYEAVERAGGVLHTQHPTWVLADRPCEIAIEVTSGWGIYIRQPGRIHKALNAGHRVGFVGTSDSHRRNPGLGGGLTGIYAESLTAEAVLAAYRARRVYATNGSHIILDSRLNGRPMGECVERARSVRLSLFARGTRPIVRAVLIRDGREVETFDGNGAQTLNVSVTDSDASPGRHWYYWRVSQAGRSPSYPSNVKVARGHLAWSSPHWVTVVE